MRHIKLLLLVFLFTSTFQVLNAQAQPKKKLIIGFYNVENLFDTIRDPQINDEDFTPSGKLAWTAVRYQQKLMRLSEVISQLGGTDGPDLLGMCEIENRKVMEDLVASPKLAKANYGIVHHNSPDERGIDVALIYKQNSASLLSYKPYRVTLSDPKDFTRDLLLVNLLASSDTIHAILCHLPSRRGGAEASNGDRVAAASMARHIMDSLLAKNNQAKIIVMGDMNDEPDNESMRNGLKTVSRPDSATNGYFYNAMASLAIQGEGSYMHNKKWNMLDQMMLSPGFVSGKYGFVYEPVSATIYKPEYLQETNEKYKGSPWRTYAGTKYLGGYSDHFSVYTSFRFEGSTTKVKKTKKLKAK